jgi:hypothetical protein
MFFGGGFCVVGCLRSAANFRYVSRSAVGNIDMAVSVFKCEVFYPVFFLVCMLYFGPFSSSFISSFVNCISVLLITLGWKVCFLVGSVCCVWVSFLAFCQVFGTLFEFLFVDYSLLRVG